MYICAKDTLAIMELLVRFFYPLLVVHLWKMCAEGPSRAQRVQQPVPRAPHSRMAAAARSRIMWVADGRLRMGCDVVIIVDHPSEMRLCVLSYNNRIRLVYFWVRHTNRWRGNKRKSPAVYTFWGVDDLVTFWVWGGFSPFLVPLFPGRARLSLRPVSH